MENPVPESLPQSDTQAEPGLAEFVAFVWQARWITFFGALLGLGLSVLYLEMATYRYTATLILVMFDFRSVTILTLDSRNFCKSAGPGGLHSAPGMRSADLAAEEKLARRPDGRRH